MNTSLACRIFKFAYGSDYEHNKVQNTVYEKVMGDMFLSTERVNQVHHMEWNKFLSPGMDGTFVHLA